jgi:hypothetical protein
MLVNTPSCVTVRTTLGGELMTICRRTLAYAFTMSIVCILTVPAFVVSGTGQIPTYALFALFGLALYLALVDLNEGAHSIDDLTSRRSVAFLLTTVMVAYYNALILLAVLFSQAFELAGYGLFSPAVAVIYPMYDAEIARHRSPLSIAGAFVTTLAALAQVVSWIEDRTGLELFRDDIDSLRRLRDSTGALQELLVDFTNRGRQRLA